MATSKETIVADGFPELIVHFGRPYAESSAYSGLVEQPNAVISGQLTKPLILHATGRVGVMAIRFRPAGMVPFTNVPMRLLADARVSAAEVFSGVDQLQCGVNEAKNDIDRVAVCERFLLRSLNDSARNVVVNNAIDVINETQGSVSVDRLAKLVHTGRRNLELMFRQHVGLSPKQLCRVIRFHHAYALLTEEHSQTAAKIAVEAGFFDQSHLIRDFRQFAGDSPETFLADPSPLTHALNG